MASLHRSNNSNKATTSHASKSVKFHPYSNNSTNHSLLRNEQSTNRNFNKTANDFVIEKENFFAFNNNYNSLNISNSNSNKKNERSLRPIEHNQQNLNTNYEYQSYLMSANHKGIHLILYSNN